MRSTLSLLPILLLVSCSPRVEDYPYCSTSEPATPPSSSQPLSWHQDVAPIIEARCAWCHAQGELAMHLPLTSYEQVFASRQAIKQAVVSRTMPPWLPAECCNAYMGDFSLSEDQITTISSWVDQGAPEGEPLATPPAPLPRVGGLSRVDLTLEMPEPYTPEPEPGHVDDFRCFVIDWPLEETKFVTGINPKPGARALLHHLVIGVASGADAKPYEDLVSPDGRPGFPCKGGAGTLQLTSFLGGSLLGGDYPEGYGTPVEPGSKIILDVHYSVLQSNPEADLTSLEFKLDDDANPSSTLVLTNPLWLADEAMNVEAGDADAEYQYRYNPRIFTGNEPYEVLGFTPHMHALGKSIRAAIIRKDGSRTCLSEIPRWEFGWEQPYWFAEPIRLEPGDDIYIDCHFDNSAENQPIVDGKRIPPRDIAWGEDNQDMCAGFLAVAKVEE